MKKLRKVISAFAVLGIVLIVGGKAFSYDLLEYFPLSQGSYWVYDCKDADDHWSWQEKYVNENYETIHGVNAIQRVYYDSDYQNMISPDDYDLLSWDSQYIYLHGTNQVGNPPWRDDPIGLSVHDPALTIKRFMNVGESHTCTSTETDPNGNMSSVSLTTTLLGIENVSVPAGDFSNCLKVQISFSNGDTDLMWWAKGVGEVRSSWSSYSEGAELELTSYYLAPIPPSSGYMPTSNLWIRAVINTEEKGPIEAVWKKGGEDTTSAGDTVIWGHFYASPSDVTWGSQNNPDLFVKIWFDHYGRLDVNFFHVSVPDIEVYSDYPYDGTADEQGTTTMTTRYIRQYYENGQSNSDENYEDGNPPSGYSPTGNPSGYSTINDLRIGSMINTVEKGGIDAIWQLGGQDTTSRGDQVVWGHFYASPSDVTWGSQDNPDLFVKIWFDVSGRVDVNFFHVSVPDIEVYSALPDDGTYDEKGTTIMDNRYIRHEYWR